MNLFHTRLGVYLANRLGRPRARRIVGWLAEDVVPAQASVLDVGCGLGHIAEALRERGHESSPSIRCGVRCAAGATSYRPRAQYPSRTARTTSY